MVARSISNQEIALIKAMVARGMKNRDIQFFFNRPQRAVNSGRITDIATGKYGGSSEIERASDDELNAYLATHTPTAEVPLVVAPAEVGASSPLSDAILRKMFSKGDGGIWHLMAGETDQAECKTSFGLKHPAAWMRAVAALANNRGGYVFFGVRDKDAAGQHQVAGMASDEFTKTDPAELAKRLRSGFDPTPRFQTATIEIGGMKVGVIHVEQHPSRPVIATKNEDTTIREGDIFFRYPGTSSRITYSDLRAMLDDRDAHSRAAMLPMIQRLLALGPARAMVADLTSGQLMDGRHTVEMDDEIIRSLTFIKEGEFDEKAGAPALRLIGDLRSSAAAEPATKKGLVTRSDMRRDFLRGELQADPIDYVRMAIEVPGTDWLPIRYFAWAAGLSHEELLAFIEDSAVAPQSQKDLYRKRLASPDKAYVKATGPALVVLNQLLEGKKCVPKDAVEARQAAQAIQGIAQPLSLDPGALRALLTRCLELSSESDDGAAKTAVRKAIARLDELTCG